VVVVVLDGIVEDLVVRLVEEPHIHLEVVEQPMVLIHILEELMYNLRQLVGDTLEVQHKRVHRETEQVEVVQEPLVQLVWQVELLVVLVELE
tara:strand:- start:190 stop:465 length:276 start_codon:yes stop_codon:yes gene_type:complete